MRCGELRFKLFRNEISRGTKRDYGAERLFARVARARIAAVPYIKLSAGDVAGAYDTFGSVKRLYYSRRDRVGDAAVDEPRTFRAFVCELIDTAPAAFEPDDLTSSSESAEKLVIPVSLVISV